MYLFHPFRRTAASFIPAPFDPLLPEMKGSPPPGGFLCFARDTCVTDGSRKKPCFGGCDTCDTKICILTEIFGKRTDIRMYFFRKKRRKPDFMCRMCRMCHTGRIRKVFPQYPEQIRNGCGTQKSPKTGPRTDRTDKNAFLRKKVKMRI